MPHLSASVIARVPPPKKAHDPMEAADRTKEREFYRYYHHSQRPKGDSRQSSPAVRPTRTPPSPPSTAPAELNPSEDKALTAFAQLGALRLNARRCLISFFDRRSCYILAEATRTLSLRTGQAEFRDDTLAWGTTIFSKEKSICYYTVQLPFIDVGNCDDHYAEVPSLVVNDLTLDDRFKHYPFVVEAPHSRFYAGVPIRSPSGHSIGTYCVLDDKPRDGLSSEELNFLKDMGVTVMRHLQMSRATDDHKRGGVMVRSLGSFADGRSTLDEWDTWEAETSVTPAGQPDTALANQPRQPTISAALPQTVWQEPTTLNRDDSTASSAPSLQSTLVTSPSVGTPDDTAISPHTDPMDVHNAAVFTKTASTTANGTKDIVAPEMKTIFSRAAQMIVDATGSAGAVFFDAKVSTWGGLVDDDFLSEQPPEPDKQCSVLGAACYKSDQGPSASPDRFLMSESVLKHLLRNYPYGQIFNLDDDVPASSQLLDHGNNEVEFSTSRRSESLKSSDDDNVLKDIFPNARSLVMYPLWDTHRDRWFASLIIWSTDPMRVFTSEQELSYLAAFSNSAMAEVARLDTKLADAAKADFISSISHELRSPLHGILGMTDLLKDTEIDTQQSSHVQTIETCGKTLLETINHVLDYAKINNLTRGAVKRPKNRSKTTKQISAGQGHTNDIMTIISDVDLSVLVEEVLESVFAGFNFQQSAAQGLEHGSENFEPHPVAVIMDINKSDNYVFRTQPGAWRRVIMNLFGNALKYTPAGYIKIKLQVVSSSEMLGECAEFRLTVTDSGIGMSKDYVNSRLFHSFAQENPLSQGTGLGLSIVKQLVDLLGGDVEVRSEQGRGTKFTVSCPMKTSTMSPAVCAAVPEHDLLNVSKRTKDLNVHFVGFDDKDDCLPIKSLENKNATRLTKKALDGVCSDWLGMKTWSYRSKDAPAPDLFMATEAGARFLRAQYSQAPDKAPAAPVVVVCRGAASAQSTTAITVPGLIFECTAHPCGPHKLAKALSSCLDRYANRLVAQATASDTALKTVTQLSLKENATPLSPISPKTMSVLVDPHRPAITSTMSAPEVRSLKDGPIKNATTVAERALNCLAVDDNPINLRLLRTFVDKLGHSHILAKNGLEAVDAYKAAYPIPTPLPPQDSLSPPSSSASKPHSNRPIARIDVVLMDINMPVMDGLEATRQIRAYERDHGLKPVTVIALTGVASSEAQQEAYASGINLFLIKPVRLADLGVVLRGVITGDEAEKDKPVSEEQIK